MRILDRRFTAGWVAWVLGFVVLEGIALYSDAPGDTLSEHVWAFTEWAGSFGYALVFALLGWLGWHFSPLENARKKHGGEG